MPRKSLIFENLNRIGRRRCIALAAIGICGILAAVAERGDIRPLAIGAARAGEAREVLIDNYSFSPGVLTVRAGTIVTWVNHDEVPHTIASVDNPRQFKSGGLDTDDKFS